MRVVVLLLLLFLILSINVQDALAANGYIGCSAGSTRQWNKATSASVGAYIQFETTLSKGSGGSSTSMRIWNYIHGLQVYYDSFYGGFGYGAVTRNYYFVLIGTALDTNVTFTHKVGAFPTSCETYGSYNTNFDTAEAVNYNAGAELQLNSTYTYIYAPQPSESYFYVTLGFRFSGANISSVTEYTIADVFGIIKINQRYSPEDNITHNYVILRSSDNSIQLKANSRDLQVTIYMKWDDTAGAWYISWVEFNNYKIYVQQHATSNAITVKSDARFSNSLYLPHQAVSQDLLEPMFREQGYITVPVAYLYYDEFNTQITRPETVQWWYDATSDTAYYKLSVSPTQQANITLYSYKLPIYIQSSQPLTDYAVRVTIDAGIVSDLAYINLSTIYFTDTAGTPLYYWLESYDPSIPKLVAWVKVPSIPASGTTIYMHWGDPAADYSHYNNATSVFPIFIGPGMWNTSSASKHAGTGSLQASIDAQGRLVLRASGGWVAWNITQPFNITNTAVGGASEIIASNTYTMAIAGYFMNNGGEQGYTMAHRNSNYADYPNIIIMKNWNTKLKGTIQRPSGEFTWELAYYSGGNIVLRVDNSIITAQDATYENALLPIGGMYNNGQSVAYRYIYVRNAVDPEPSVSYGSVTVDKQVGWELQWPRQISFKYEGRVVVDYVLVGATPVDAFVQYSGGKSTVWIPYPRHATGFVNFEVYWHVGNASSYGLAPVDNSDGNSGTGGSNSTNTTVPIGGGGLQIGGPSGSIMQAEGVWMLLRYSVPVAVTGIMIAAWGVAGAVASSMPLLYLSYAGLAPAWLVWLPTLGGILYVAFKIYTRRVGA